MGLLIEYAPITSFPYFSVDVVVFVWPTIFTIINTISSPTLIMENNVTFFRSFAHLQNVLGIVLWVHTIY